MVGLIPAECEVGSVVNRPKCRCSQNPTTLQHQSHRLEYASPLYGHAQ